MRVALPRRSLPLVIAQFSCFLGVGAVLPLLPVHLVTQLHVDGLLLGFVLGIYPFAALVGRFVGGWAADLHGRFITLALCLVGFSATGFLLMLPLDPSGIFGLRLFQGFFQGALTVAAVTWMMDISAPSQRAYSLSMIGAGVWGGTTVGVLAGGAMNSLAASGALAGISALLGIPALKWAERPPPFVPSTESRTFMPRAAIVPGVTFALGAMGYSAIVGFIVLHLNARGTSGITALSCFTATVLLGRFIAVPIATRWGLQRSLLPVLFLSAVGLVLLSYAQTTLVAVIGVVLVAIAHSLLWPALGSLVASNVASTERGAAIGLMTALYDIAIGLSSIIFGIMATQVGTADVFLVAAGFVICAALFDALCARNSTGKSSKDTLNDVGEATLL